ncbi:subtilisin family serine protease [Saccharothrix tamanrassetensis]|uniref:Subtilisin family serine protease n=1 Tax=Saccharothrix tamanrassetensis TaxID=1051531 RepID=A0A841CQQ4_9PSEU|nr:S8 family serine peptidase [Saccharothrix tamanrassetensis]MBB5958325.1 subtilisin family serine protease [Saccharothrix tamanrassetensis]
MSRSGKRGAWGFAALTVGLIASGTGAATAAPQATDHRTTAGEQTSVTLITGDRVLLDGDRLGSVTRGPGRDETVFHHFQRDGRLHVVPHDAVRPLAEGKLDLRLFDVTGLAEAGYDDARRDDVPLIVTGRTGAAGIQVTRDLPAVGAVAARAAKSEAATAFRSLVADPAVRKVWLDGLRRTSLDRSTAQIGAPAAWSAGYTGKGVKVAVLDGGVDGAHPDLAGQEIAERNFTEEPDATDNDGHGTHVAATIASKHAEYRGVAPDAQILDGKVCVQGGCAESWILDGMQWAADQGADVVNLSLGGGDRAEIDPLEEAVNRLSAGTGTLFVIAAGNSGRPGSVSSPSTADAALSVGAVERDDSIAPFSSRGPRAGDGGVKPDVTAPGVDIAAAKAAKGNIGTPVDATHVALSGTSMATPHVAGAAALLAQQHPDWTGAQLKATLVASAKNNPDLTVLDQGTGRIDLAKAITTAVTSDPVSVGLGLQQWPHDDDVPVTKEITYRNTGKDPLTLDLTVDVKGPDGKPAPAGVFTVTPAKVTVPAGGTAKTTVTGDSKAAAVDGVYVGAVVASNGLRTPVSLSREVESYDVTFKYTDANGNAPTRYSSLVIGLDNDAIAFPEGPASGAKARLPKGDYFVFNDVLTEGGTAALLPQPLLEVTGTTTVDADARIAKPIKITFPDPAAVEQIGDISLTRNYRDRRFGFGTAFFGGISDRVSLAQLGPVLPAEELSTMVHSHATGASVGTTPVNYRLAWVEAGKVPTGFVRAPGKDELAKVDTRIRPRPAGRTYRYGGLPLAPGGGSSGTLLTPVGPAGDAIDHVIAKGLEWSWVVFQLNDQDRPEALLRSPDRTYRPGREYHERFGKPVFGPTLTESDYPYTARRGDEIGFGVPLWGDGDGNTGNANTESARTTLYRDGKKIGETTYPANGLFEVPAGRGDFKVDTEAVRVPGSSEFSTRVAGTWTFRSDTVPGTEFKPLPLTVVRFEPKLDDEGTAPANKVLRVPLAVQQQKNGPDGKVRRLDVEVSFDDGEKWSKVPVTGRTALVRNGDAGGFASLRVKGSDSKGNTFEHTVIRAYKIRK